jgi:hypothetical protein
MKSSSSVTLLMFRHHSCLSARVKVTSLNRITISRMYETRVPGHQADRTSPLLASSMTTARAICLVQLCTGQCNTIEDCAKHRFCDQPNTFSSTSGQHYKGGTTVSPVPGKISQKSFPDSVTNTVRDRTCLRAHLGRMVQASCYDRLPSFSPSCINAHAANVSQELRIESMCQTSPQIHSAADKELWWSNMYGLKCCEVEE